MLLEEFLNPGGITQRQLADAIHVPYQRINEIVNGKRGITPATALRLAKFFGMSVDYWMNLRLDTPWHVPTIMQQIHECNIDGNVKYHSCQLMGGYAITVSRER